MDTYGLQVGSTSVRDLFIDLCKELMVPKKVILLIADFDRTASILWDQHLVPRCYAGCYSLSILIQPPRSYSQNLCLRELLHTALGQEDAGCSFGLGLEPLDEDAVEEWC